ncbi:MAG: DUF1549 domain-containing protein [Planctomycetia bacterium]|nr:DUF1549 domain-containing protein [Planctomycetia bacterium]
MRRSVLHRVVVIASIVTFLGISGTSLASDQVPAKEVELFEKKIRPVLVGQCYECHSAEAVTRGKLKGMLTVDTRAGLLKGGDSGPAIVPGKPSESLLLNALRHDASVSAMPPKEKLSAAVIADFEAWIAAGAADPRDGPAAVVKRGLSIDEGRKFWSFVPPQRVAPPSAQGERWAQSSVDAFIRAKHEAVGLTPAPPADKRAALRRITFDLTGLPPSPEELREFLSDAAPDAFARVVDRLLASPQYGERWGRHWLDVVRYADARDLIQLPIESDFREAWRYRDWVVAAFNRDLPYNEFITRQLAGDLMQPLDPTKIDAESLVATGMLAIADFVPGDVDKQQMIADYVNDEIDVVGRAFLGLTLACARCHDHKFDPISTEDYYALAGIFFSTRVIPSPVLGNTPLVRMPLLPAAEIQAINTQTQRDKLRLAELSQIVQVAADQEFLLHLERQLVAATPRDLPAAVEFFHAKPSTPADFAAARKLDASTLERWVKFLKQQPPPSALLPLLAETDHVAAARLAEELVKKLSMIAAERRERTTRDPVAWSLATAEFLQFRADDRHIATNAARQITLWPDRAAIADDATPPPDSHGPVLATEMIHGHSRPVIRFDGDAVLQSPRTVPLTGALFAVFRPDAAVGAGTRLIGWEDSAVGQHGLGLMLNAAGGLHAIVRRAGASGDIVAPAPANSDFQLISLTWGSGGVALFRNGEAIGTNKSIDAVSSDPAIAALRIGGPGSGAGQRFRGDLCELRVYGSPLDEAARVRVESELRARWLAPLDKQAASGDDVSDLYDELLSSRSPYWIAAADRSQLLPQEVRERLAAQRDELELLKKKPAVVIPQAVVVQDGGPLGTKHEGFHDAPVFLRGNPATPGKMVPRGFPQVLAGPNSPKISAGSGRRELADWLTRPDSAAGGLTARVMVNRIWQHHFGEGLVRTSTNFGVRGEQPSHPELLDHLARRFIESGWSIKALHRLIVLSSVYQQSTFASDATRAVDPENRWLARMPRRRLEAEAIRDSLLAVSGRLDATPGGPGFLEVAVPRRTLYLMTSRTGAKTADFNSLFDGPDGGGIIERRNPSIVAPQALYLLNDPLLDDVSAALAARVAREVPSGRDDERIARLYELAFGRAPTPTEIGIGRQLVADPAVKEAWARYCRVILCTNEFVYVD